MDKNKRDSKRQRAINARRQAASQPSGSLIVNELHHLYGADNETVLKTLRWRAKANIVFILGFNLLAFLFILYFTKASEGSIVARSIPYVWACFVGFFILQMIFLHRYWRLIRNA